MEAFPLSCPFQLYAKLVAELGTKCSGKTALSTLHNFSITTLVFLTGKRMQGMCWFEYLGSPSNWEA